MLFFEVLCARTWICSLKEQSHFLPWKLVLCLWFLAMWLPRYAEKGGSSSMNAAFKSFFWMKIWCGGEKRFLKQNISSFLSRTRSLQAPDLAYKKHCSQAMKCLAFRTKQSPSIASFKAASKLDLLAPYGSFVCSTPGCLSCALPVWWVWPCAFLFLSPWP